MHKANQKAYAMRKKVAHTSKLSATLDSDSADRLLQKT